MQASNEPSSIFDDLKPQLNAVDNGRRFGHYLIDVVMFYLTAMMLWVLLLSFDVLTYDDAENKWMDYLVTYLAMILYYTLMEGLTKGKTMGKYITKSRAVKTDGSPITLKDAFLRTLSRIVPFEAFSAFSSNSMWHDRWANTIVVKE